jgi:16S rRNA (cytidine1402-2'-O)-methyltransferase
VAVLGPDRLVCWAREVTKKFETFLLGPAGAAPARLTGDNRRGEFTVLIAPAGFEL